ncbi:MAG: lactonase family protein [Tannerellaceae bacterium]|jgi:hypothetical protein|nr:lactonase family protein [Tannerellaceae bacterium]
MKQLIPIICVWLLWSCEYPVHDHFIEIQKPAEAVEMAVYLTADNDGERIVLSESSTLKYNLSVAGGRRIQGCIFEMGERRWEFPDQSSGYIYVDKSDFPDGEYTLSCTLYAATESGSIADQLGAESYAGSFSWPLTVTTYYPPAASLRHAINADGYLELSWDRPDIGVLPFYSYQVTGTYWGVDIRDMAQTSFVDRSYVGENRWYNALVYFENKEISYREPWSLGYIQLNEVDPVFEIDYSQEDSIRLSWDNPYKSAVNIALDYSPLVAGYKEKSIRIPYAPFGARQKPVQMTFIPYEETDRTYANGFSKWLSVVDSHGKKVSSSDYFYGIMAYHVTEDVLYVSDHDTLTSLVMPDAVVYKEKVRYNSYIKSIYASLSDLTVAVCDNNLIDLYDGKAFRNVRTVIADPQRYFTGAITLTDKGKLLCLSYNGAAGKTEGQVYDATTALFEASFELPAEIVDLSNVFITPDARYLYTSSYSAIYVVSLDEAYRVTGTKRLDMYSSGWCVNPRQTNQLFASANGKIYQFDVAAGLSPVSVWDYPGMFVANIDPATGYLLLVGQAYVAGSDYVKIIRPETNEELATIPVSGSTNYRLAGNTLMSGSGYVMNIKKQLKK